MLLADRAKVKAALALLAEVTAPKEDPCPTYKWESEVNRVLDDARTGIWNILSLAGETRIPGDSVVDFNPSQRPVSRQMTVTALRYANEMVQGLNASAAIDTAWRYFNSGDNVNAYENACHSIAYSDKCQQK